MPVHLMMRIIPFLCAPKLSLQERDVNSRIAVLMLCSMRRVLLAVRQTPTAAKKMIILLHELRQKRNKKRIVSSTRSLYEVTAVQSPQLVVTPDARHFLYLIVRDQAPATHVQQSENEVIMMRSYLCLAISCHKSSRPRVFALRTK
jgi:hypothetical protein